MRSLLTSLRRVPFGVRGLATEASASAPAAASAAAPAAEASTSTSSAWTPFTQRTGIVAKKRGMTALWDADGRRWPVTVLQLDAVQVVRHTLPPANDPKQLHALQIGSTDANPKTATNQMLGHFRKAGVKPKHHLQEFRVTADAVLPVGAELGASHFVPGQYVDVTATR
jgi:large subunit ribosomal protein L3